MIRSCKISNLSSTDIEEHALPKLDVENLSSPNNFETENLQNNSGILKIIENQQTKSLVGSTPS